MDFELWDCHDHFVLLLEVANGKYPSAKTVIHRFGNASEMLFRAASPNILPNKTLAR